MKYKVMITDTCFPDISIEEEELQKIDAELVVSAKTDEQTLIETGKDCDAIIFDYAMVTDKVLSQLTKCKVAVRYGVGVNSIDLDAASKYGIMVANVSDYCLDEVADHTIALFLACSRRLNQYSRKTRECEWDVSSVGTIHRLSGQKYCLYGFGNIAQKVAARAKAFHCDVYACDPFIPDEVFTQMGVTRVDSLKEMASFADVLSIHVPLVHDTEGSVNAEVFNVMKDSAIVINTSRGPVVNEADLLETLKQGKFMGAGLDVLVDEPPAKDYELLQMDNVIITPHVAFFSAEAEAELRHRVAQEVIYGLTEGKPHSFINKDAFR